MIAAFDFAEFYRFEVNMREHGEARLGLVFAEKLCLQVNRQIADFFLGKNRFLNFFLGGLGWIFCGARSVIAAARLNAELLLTCESYFQSVKTAVEFQVLRRKSQEIGRHRGGDCFAQRNVNVVAIVIKSATGSGSEIIEDFFLRELRLNAIAGLEACGLVGIYRRAGDVAAKVWSIEAARVQRVDHDASTVGAVNDVHALQQKSRENETGRDEDHFPLARHSTETAQDIFHVAIGVVRSHIAAVYGSESCARRQSLRRGQLGFISVKGALNGVLRGDAYRLRVLFVRNEVGLVIRKIWTIMER